MNSHDQRVVSDLLREHIDIKLNHVHIRDKVKTSMLTKPEGKSGADWAAGRRLIWAKLNGYNITSAQDLKRYSGYTTANDLVAGEGYFSKLSPEL